MQMDNFLIQVESLKTNCEISNYFINNNINIIDFIESYIKVDNLVRNNDQFDNQTSLEKKLDNLQNQIHSLSNTNIKNELLELFNSNFNSLSSISSNVSKDLENIKTYIGNTVTNLHSNNDKRIFQQMSQLITSLSFNDKLSTIHELVANLHTNLTSHSTNKGAISENILHHKLTAEFPDADVIETRNIPRSGDFILNRANKPKIMIDIKNYQRNVPTTETDKFFRDIEFQKCSGILASVQSGIACKQNFDIELVDNKYIVVFIHNFNFDAVHIRLATNVIDHLSSILESQYNLDNIILPRESFGSLKSEYETFLSVFNNHINIIQSNVQALSSLQLTLLDQFFSSKLQSQRTENSSRITPFFCSTCKRYYKTKFTLDRHILEKHP